MKKIILVEIIVLFILSLLPLWWFTGDQILLGHDSGFRLAPLDHLRNLFYSWNPFINYGRDWSLYKAFLVIQFPETFFALVTGSAAWGQRMALVLWFFFMGMGAWLGVYLIFPHPSYRFFRMWVGIFAMYNFFILQAWFIAERAKFSLFAAMPIGLALLYRALVLKKSMVIHAIAFGFLYFFLNGGGSPPLYGATAVSWLGAYVWFSIVAFKENGWQSARRSILAGLLFAGVFIFLNAYWIVPQIGLYIGTYAQAFDDNGGMEGLIAWERTISKNASILNLLRLQGVPDWYDMAQHPFSRAFLTNPLLIVLSFIPVLLAGLTGLLLWFGKKKEKKQHVTYVLFLFALLLVGLVLAAGSHPPFGSAFVWAMRHVPGFAIFRSSFYKFGPLVWFPIIMLSGYALHHILERVKNDRARLVAGVACLLGLLMYHYPFFYSDIFRFYDGFTTRVTVPEYVKEMGSYVNTNIDSESRILVLPALDSGYYNIVLDTTSWGYFSLDLLPRTVFKPIVVANDKGSNNVTIGLYEAVTRGDKQTFEALARIGGITHILWRGDAVYKNSYSGARGIESQRDNFLSWGFPAILKKDKWELYKVPSVVSSPHITLAHGAVTVSGQNVRHETILTNVLQSSDVVLVDNVLQEALDSIQSSARGIVYQASCIYCKDEDRTKMLEELVIPDLRFSPDSFLHKRMIAGQLKALGKATTPSSRIDVQIIRANTLLAIYKWRTTHKMAISEDILKEYQAHMDDILTRYGLLSGKEKNNYSIRLLSFIHAQNRYISAIESDSQTLKDLHTRIDEYKKQVTQDIWMTEQASQLKYELEILSSGLYTLVSIHEGMTVTINGIPIGKNPITIEKGYHKVLVTGHNLQEGIPELFFTHIDEEVAKNTGEVVTMEKHSPAHYTVNVDEKLPYYLLLHEEFDRRWKLKIRGKQVSESLHVRINGYANGWLVEELGPQTLTIYYEPYDQFKLGIAISLSGFIIAIGSMVWWSKRR